MFGGVVLAAIAALLSYVAIASYAEVDEALVLRQDVDPFDELSADMLVAQEMPAAAIPDDALRDLERVEGKYSKGKLLSGTVLEEGHLAEQEGGSLMSAALTYTEDENMRAFPLPYDELTTVGGTIHEEDRIDLLASFPTPDGQTGVTIVSESTRVLDIHRENDFEAVVIAVTYEQAEELALLLQEGEVYASLNPYEAVLADTDGYITINELAADYGMPRADSDGEEEAEQD